MALLAGLKDKEAPEDEAPDMAGVGETAETDAAPQPEPEKDAFDALGDIVQEQKAPSINDDPAPAQARAEADGAEAETPAMDDDEAQLRSDRVKAFAKEHNIPEDEAERQMDAADKAHALAAGMGGSRREAEDEAKAAAMEKALRRASGGGGGGGAVGSLIGGLSSLVKGTAGSVRNAAGKFRVDNSPEARITRKFNLWYEDYTANLETFEKSGADLKQRREEFNAAFMSTEAASRLRRMADDSGKSFDEFMSDLNGGRNSAPEAVAAAEEAFNDARSQAAWSRLQETEKVAKQSMDDMLKSFGKIERNFADRIDPAQEAQILTSANEDFMEGMKGPIYEGKQGTRKGASSAETKADPEEQKKFMERMKEMSEHIRQMVERLLSKIGLAPRA